MKPFDLSVYFVMGTENCVDEEPLSVLEDALKNGVTMFQFREKGPNALTGEQYITFARNCQSLCKKYNVPFIVNDDVELAITLDADGIHVGQDDASLKDIRDQFKDKIVGVSVHNKNELDDAVSGGADYVGIGSIYVTMSKPDAEHNKGITMIKEVRSYYPDFPIVGIGGITTTNASPIIQAGANGVAIISAICRSHNRKETIKHFLQIKSTV